MVTFRGPKPKRSGRTFYVGRLNERRSCLAMAGTLTPTMETGALSAAVRRELLAHPGVTEGSHRFDGGLVFHLGRRELGHLHGEHTADIPLPAHIREALLAEGRIAPQHLAADSDWVSRRADSPGDVAQIVELFRISYEHAASLPDLPEEPEPQEEPEPGWREALTPRFLRRRRARG